MLKEKIIRQDVAGILETELPWETFCGKTVLISGANGYVTAYFVHTFIALNDRKNMNMKIIALCRNEKRAKARFADYLDRKDLVLYIQDVCEPIAIEERVHFFIHGASPAGIHARHRDPVATFCANVTGCENMLKLAVKNPCEGFLLISSVDIYGSMAQEGRLTEAKCGILDHLNVRNAYSCGKKAAETLCCAYYKKYKIPVTVVRPFQIFGPGPELDDGRLHIDFISQMLEGDRIVLKSDGSAKRTFIYITDAMEGMLTALLRGSDWGVYNIVDESGEATVLELAELMASLVSDRKIEIVFDYEKRGSVEVKGALPSVTGSSKKLRELGWKAHMSLAEGAERMMNYYGLKTGLENVTC
ncbi:MAG: NAD(P)-dependent oxidoreductase [Clostridium sp.]|nr:NAD(P)-dependent oxidoreductase [Clostridium sp.]